MQQLHCPEFLKLYCNINESSFCVFIQSNLFCSQINSILQMFIECNFPENSCKVQTVILQEYAAKLQSSDNYFP